VCKLSQCGRGLSEAEWRDGMVCLLAAPRAELSVSAGSNGCTAAAALQYAVYE